MSYYLTAIMAVMLGATSQLLMKIGTLKWDDEEQGQHYGCFNRWSVSGYLMMSISGVLYFIALKVVPLKDMVFILPISYIATPMLSVLILKEQINNTQWRAIMVIIIGIVVFNFNAV